MKHIHLIIFIFLVTGASVAQESKHMTFKGIPINGTLNSFVNQLKSQGFDHIGTEDGIAFLLGDFASFKRCTIGVTTLKQKDLVDNISVLFLEKETWSSLSGDYFYLKELLTEKYGEPTEVTEKFDSPIQPRDDEDRMYKVKFDNCKYSSKFETDRGDIILSIEHIGVSSCFVKLSYLDKINTNIIRQKAIDDL